MPAHLYEIRPRNDRRGVELISDVLPFGRRWYYDSLPFADAKDREEPRPPISVLVVGFRNEASVAKDRSPITNIDAGRAFISFKEMPITPVEANYDGREVACG